VTLIKTDVWRIIQQTQRILKELKTRRNGKYATFWKRIM
jgi:hypothetical protein